MLWRSFLTNLRIAVHTLATHIADSCKDPWVLDSSDIMYTQTPSSKQENDQLMQEATALQLLVKRLDCQLTHVRHLLQHGKNK